ncbi:hypothetical protein [Burkholderia sp. 8Y]|uniref:hypothetical protein n=1 Tax=Burkholderia sp. 8Y TaxID=2653133 RepID=UPI00135C6A34
MIQMTVLAAFACFFGAAHGAHAGQLEVVSVTATGFGSSAASATVDAVRNGVASVNGERIESTERLTKSSTSSTGAATQSSRSIDEDIRRTTNGVVKSWRALSTQPADGGYQATVQVGVAVLKQSEQMKRIKIAVVPSHGQADASTAAIVDAITTDLVESRKFAILDRQQKEAIEAQMAQIRAGTQIEDFARLSSGVAPDFLAIVTTRTNAGSGEGTTQIRAQLQVIDYSSRQIKFAEQKSINVKGNDRLPAVKRLLGVAHALSGDLLQSIYPPLVVGNDNGTLTIAEGSSYFKVGDKCAVRLIESTLKDPYTKEFLGYKSSEVGTATITYSDARISQATLDHSQPLDAGTVAARKYQAWRVAASANDLFNSLAADMGGRPAPGHAQAESHSIESDY